ncbi:MAG TPA: RNase H family protein [Vicinamibacterales bacterium]
MSDLQAIVVFTDGAAKGNPGPGAWGVIIVTPAGEVTEHGARAAQTTTNNRMELTGAIEALSALRGLPGALAIYTDSTYVIQGIRGWIFGWRKRGWKTAAGADVLNRDLWERLDALVSARGKGGVAWHYVRGHAGIPGNERVDAIADGLAQGLPITLYRGPLLGYPYAILDLPSETDVPARSSSGGGPRAKGAPFSYLSVVDGQLARHATWADCERRVKGRAGARFKKAMSAAEETAILRAWQME